MDDQAIVALYWARDEQAIGETAAKFGAYCRKIADNILNSAHDAEECENDTWLAAWNSMPDNRPARLAPYLGLPAQTRTIFLRRYWYCDATADIAARCGVTETKVRVTLHRTRGKLAAYLQEKGVSL